MRTDYSEHALFFGNSGGEETIGEQAGGARLALSANGILYLQFGANGITAINLK